MKNKWLVCAMCALSVGFVACSDDDDEENGGNGGPGGGSGTPAMEAPAVSGAGIRFPVTTVNKGYDGLMCFSYANGKMTQGWEYYGNDLDYIFRINSNPLTIVYTDEDGTADEQYHSIKVNGSGFITYCELTAKDEDDYEERVTVSCTYDGEGHLISEKGSGWDNEGYKEEFTTVYTWENGNLVKFEENSVETEDGETSNGRYVCELEYDGGKYPNPGIFLEMDVTDGSLFFYQEFFYAGLAGRCSKNIPVRIKEQSGEGGYNYTHTTEITNVVYNENGSVKSVVFPGRTYQYGYEPVSLSRSAAGASASAGKKAPRALRRLRERRMK